MELMTSVCEQAVVAASSDEHVAARPRAACTIISRNYLSHARILANSYAQHEPGGRFYLLVVDGLPAGTDLGVNIHVIDPEELALPYFYEMCFKYDVTELCTAVKPSLLLLLLDRYADEVIYFDPDILIMRRLEELQASLRSASIVLTPHLLKPIPLDGRRPSEQDILIAGTYNLGFIALRKSDETYEFLQWWQQRLRDSCRVDLRRGLMTDQRWIDLIPSLWASTRILRDDTYNVAYWNTHSRVIEKHQEQFLVNGRPLAFFHFSGFDPAKPQEFSKHQNRLEVTRGTALADLLDLYVDLHMKNGYATSSKWPYGYSTFDNGVAVHPVLRQLYLSCGEELRKRFANPFRVNGPDSFLQWVTTPRPERGNLSPFLESIYWLRYDMAAEFPHVPGKDISAFANWAGTRGAHDMGYDPRLVCADNAWPASTDNSSRSREAELARESDTGVSESSLTGVNVCGYLRNESGLGTAARGYIRALGALRVPIALKDLSKLSVNRSEDRTLAVREGNQLYDINILCANADQHFVIMSHLGEDFFRGRYNIGVWFWELPHFPEKWHDRFAYYDEIWVGTSFIANMVAPISPIPVVRVPPVLTARTCGSRDSGRVRLSVSADTFLYLFIFDFHSYFERKNPLALIEAFKKAFAPSEAVCLAIKCVNEDSDPDNFAAMGALAQGYPISICPGYWTAEEMSNLMAAADAYVSLHRSEGMGLTMAEAMALGKPVIATAWSGNTDFMNVSNSFPVRYELVELQTDVGPYQAGEIWAEPSVEHAAELMRSVFENREEGQTRGQAAKREIKAHYSEEKVAAIIRHRLAAIAKRRHELPARWDLEAQRRILNQIRYRQLVGRIRDVVQAAVPADSTVLVASKGDPELLNLNGRQAWHFPQTEDGTYAGYYPAHSAMAIAHLEALRVKGGEFLLLPQSAFWWLDHYVDFKNYLESHYRVVVRQEDTCLIFALLKPLVSQKDCPDRNTLPLKISKDTQPWL